MQAHLAWSMITGLWVGHEMPNNGCKSLYVYPELAERLILYASEIVWK